MIQVSALPQPLGTDALRQGIRENWRQFTLQMVLNLLVGMTLGCERTVLPLIGKGAFHVESFLFIGSFVISFGVVKAALNLFGGWLSDRYGRRPMLVAGCVAALPIPVLLIWAPNWGWVIVTNVLLGINQGLAWSISVNAKIDLAGPARRGLAVGLGEAAGWGGLAIAALITGYLAGAYGLRTAPFIFSGVVILVAIVLALMFMQETLPYALAEAKQRVASPFRPDAEQGRLSFKQVFLRASVRDRTLFAVSQAAGVEKFVDALVWIAVPLYLHAQGLSVEQIGEVVFVYALIWSVAQIPAGHLADLLGRKGLIVSGMAICTTGVLMVTGGHDLPGWLLAAAVMGLGMALLYPTLMTAAADACHPSWRATGLGVYRFWRDGGYAVGAVFIGLLASRGGLPAAFYGVAIAMACSMAVLLALMRETRPVS